MKQLGMLCPTVGGGLGGLPSTSASGIIETTTTIPKKDYSFARVGSTFSTTNGSKWSLYFDDNNIYTYSQTAAYCGKYTFNRSTEVLTQVGMGTSVVTFSGSVSITYENMPFDIIVSNTLVASAETGNIATRSGSSITFSTVVPTSGTTTINSYSYTSFGYMKIRKCRNSNRYVAVTWNGSSTAVIFVLDSLLNVLYSKSVSLGLSPVQSSLWVHLDKDDNIIISVSSDGSSLSTISFVVNKYNIDTLSKIGSTSSNSVSLTDTSSKYIYIQLVMYNSEKDEIYAYCRATTASTHVITVLRLVWNSDASKYVSETYSTYPTLSTYRIENTANNITFETSAINKMLGLSWSELSSASQKLKYNGCGMPYIDCINTYSTSDHIPKYSSTYDDEANNFIMLEFIEQENYFKRSSSSSYIYLKGGCTPKVKQINHIVNTGVYGVNYGLNIDGTYYFIMGSSNSGSDTAVCMVKRTEV